MRFQAIEYLVTARHSSRRCTARQVTVLSVILRSPHSVFCMFRDWTASNTILPRGLDRGEHDHQPCSIAAYRRQVHLLPHPCPRRTYVCKERASNRICCVVHVRLNPSKSGAATAPWVRQAWGRRPFAISRLFHWAVSGAEGSYGFMSGKGSQRNPSSSSQLILSGLVGRANRTSWSRSPPMPDLHLR